MNPLPLFKQLTGACLLAAGCALIGLLAAPPAAAQLKTGGTLRYAYAAGPGTLDPYVSSSAVELEVIHHLFEALVTIGEKYETKPMVAEGWQITDDAKTFTFKLRRGIRFHDGSTLTSADVLASFERYRRISPNAVVLNDVKSVEAPDANTFIVKLNKTNAVFVEILKSPVYPFVILPKGQKDKAPREVDIIGTGPFKLGEWVKDSHLVLQRFDGYVPNTSYAGNDGYAGRRTVYLDAVRYAFIGEPNARVAALQAGDTDVVAGLLPDLAKRLAGNPNLQTISVFPFCMQVFVVNSAQGPTANVKLRQAINAVVDVEEISLAMGAVSKPNHSLVYEFSPFYQGDAMKRYYDQKNPEKAKALLKEAGYKGEEITLMTTAAYPNFRNAILVLAELMKAAGMKVKVDVVDWTTNASNMQRGTGTWNVSSTAFCSNPLVGPQQWRTMFYTFPQVKNDTVLDAAYEQFYTSLELPKRKEAWDVIENRVLEQAYMIKIADMGTINALNQKKVEGFGTFYLPRFWNVGIK
jgi:peptide/nickel transport system substrate-binding protein